MDEIVFGGRFVEEIADAFGSAVQRVPPGFGACLCGGDRRKNFRLSGIDEAEETGGLRRRLGVLPVDSPDSFAIVPKIVHV